MQAAVPDSLHVYLHLAIPVAQPPHSDHQHLSSPPMLARTAGTQDVGKKGILPPPPFLTEQAINSYSAGGLHDNGLLFIHLEFGFNLAILRAALHCYDYFSFLLGVWLK